MRATAWIPILVGLSIAPVATSQQPTPERITREQDEVLRKVERLRQLMTRLLERYDRDGKSEQAELLRRGLSHLEQSQLFKAASSIQTELDNGALDDVVRDQAAVVTGLEQLLDILLDRQSLENLDQQIEATQAMIARADELLRRQRELRDQANDARDSRQSNTERNLLEELRTLATEQRAESEETERQAGLRMPTLESALSRIQQLIGSQAALEEAARSQLAGERPASAERGFELGALENEQRELMAGRDAARDLERVASAANDLEEAVRNDDAERVQEAHDRLRARLESQTANPDASPATRVKFGEQLTRLEGTSARPSDEAARKELLDAASAVRESAEGAAKSASAALDRKQQELAERSRREAEQHRADGEEESRPDSVGRGLEQAAEAMDSALNAGEEGDSQRVMSETSSALRRLAEARRAHRDANPTARKRAERMAAGADETARDLRDSRLAGDAELQAANALESAEQALRSVGQQLGSDEEGSRANSESVESGLQASSEALQSALEAIQSAMNDATAGRSESLDAARDRQRELRERAATAKQQIEDAERAGDLSPEQARAANESVDSAMKSMERAEQQLESGQPSHASGSQSNAADALDQAQRGIERNRPLSDQERERLKEVAEQQKQLEEDIIQLAKLAQERENRRAQNALEEAAQSASRAAEELEAGEPQEADEQQQRAEDKLEEARQELERERDRYMDLRQEELLFKIASELQQFLDSQLELTAATEDAGKQLEEHGRLSRPARRQLNQVAEQESELAARLDFILQALVEEGVLVFSHAISSNVEDLEQVISRLSGRRPDPGPFTVLLQKDVEDRTRKLIEALQREQQRREEQRQQGQQNENQFGQQKEPLVPVLAELKMLRQMEEDMQARTRELDRLLATGGDEVSDFDIAMSERIAHQHGAITELFQQIKARIEKSLEPPQDETDLFGGEEEEGK
ncbi:MAG: hypothetical protein KDB80_12540 [Planctomycetes bacterium]|nr:hypothetical protein [Planctomycetota bacterium]